MEIPANGIILERFSLSAIARLREGGMYHCHGNDEEHEEADQCPHDPVWRLSDVSRSAHGVITDLALLCSPHLRQLMIQWTEED